MDTNDHAPVFEATSSEYQASVRESVPPGSIVTTVRATDKAVSYTHLDVYKRQCMWLLIKEENDLLLTSCYCN